MNDYIVMNILDMIEAIGEDDVRSILSGFSCPLNPEIENFIRNNAVEFARKKMAITYLVVDYASTVYAIFTLTHKAVEIPDEGLSSTIRKKVQRYAQLDNNSGSYCVSAFLIAQFSKNYLKSKETNLSGNTIMDYTFEVLKHIQHDIGGGIVFLECEEKIELLAFYQNEQNHFRPFGERYSIVDNKKYIQLLHLF